jgi:hypothetical protein
MIVRSDESFTVGGKTVHLTDILEKAYAKNKKSLKNALPNLKKLHRKAWMNMAYMWYSPETISGTSILIYSKNFMLPGESDVALDADEPLDTGHSSGVGKVLKFSEIMVIIYNLIEEKIVMDIDLIEPLSKIVIYNMGDVFSLLSDIRFDQIDQIQFDGRTIWIPAPKT